MVVEYICLVLKASSVAYTYDISQYFLVIESIFSHKKKVNFLALFQDQF